MVYDDDTGRRVGFDIEPEDRQYNYTGSTNPSQRVRRQILEVAHQHPRWNVQDIADYLRERGERVSDSVVDTVLKQVK